MPRPKMTITIDHNTNAWYNYYQNEAPKPAAEKKRFLAQVHSTVTTLMEMQLSNSFLDMVIVCSMDDSS